MGTHPSGVTGVSVESAIELTKEELAAKIPHGQVGVTSVGNVRALGGDVIRTSGRSPYHATLTGLYHFNMKMHKITPPPVAPPLSKGRL
ncbi:hypothetical protein, partial [Brunnivagina elsteri]|uniref:hypothetical protein n=1 Tax=Brunnivagina elsteri TaxID=1247191 RepID=UPI001FE9DF7C